MKEIAADALDRLCTVEIRAPGLPRGTIARLYEAARQRYGRPLTLLCAERLQQACSEGGTVVIGTGVGIEPYLPFGETDGPLGAAALARALSLGLGVTPVIVSEPVYLEPIAGAVEGAGMFAMEYQVAQRRRGAVALVEQRVDSDERDAADFVDRYEPSAVIAIEKLGPNRRGVFHSVFGIASAQPLTKFHLVVQEAMRRGILTVGIGDGGNEIGYGAIFEAVREIVPYGRKCQCPCDDGTATDVATDIIFPGAISDWAAYGIAACLAILKEDHSLVQDAPTQRRMMEECVRRGGADSVTGLRILADDGVPLNVNEALVEMLGGVVGNALRTDEAVVI